MTELTEDKPKTPSQSHDIFLPVKDFVLVSLTKSWKQDSLLLGFCLPISECLPGIYLAIFTTSFFRTLMDSVSFLLT